MFFAPEAVSLYKYNVYHSDSSRYRAILSAGAYSRINEFHIARVSRMYVIFAGQLEYLNNLALSSLKQHEGRWLNLTDQLGEEPKMATRDV